MNFVQLTMQLLIYAFISALAVNTAGGVEEPVEFPVLVLPSFNYIDISGGCSSFTDCTEYLANVLYNIGVGVIGFVETIFAIIAYVFDLITVIGALLISGLTGAPAWLNAIIGSYFGISFGVIIYKTLRSGSDNA